MVNAGRGSIPRQERDFVRKPVSACARRVRWRNGGLSTSHLQSTRMLRSGGQRLHSTGDYRSNRATPSIILATLSFGVLTLALALAGSYQEMMVLRFRAGHRDRRPASTGLVLEYRLHAARLPGDGGHPAVLGYAFGDSSGRTALDLVRSLRLAVGLHFWRLRGARRRLCCSSSFCLNRSSFSQTKANVRI